MTMWHAMRARTAAAAVAVIACVVAPAPARAAELLVAAAASLTNAMREIGPAFEAKHPGTRVQFSFAASDVLLTQIVNGAPVDIFISADDEAMDRGERAHAIDASTRRDVAANKLVLIVPASASPPVALADLASPRIARIAIGSPQTVPAGRYAKGALDKAQLGSTLAQRFVYAANVRQALDYVARGEVDAGFVYATDAALVGDRVKVAFIVPTVTPIRYPAAVVRASKNAATARAFVDYLQSALAQQVLARFGFVGQ